MFLELRSGCSPHDWPIKSRDKVLRQGRWGVLGFFFNPTPWKERGILSQSPPGWEADLRAPQRVGDGRWQPGECGTLHIPSWWLRHQVFWVSASLKNKYGFFLQAIYSKHQLATYYTKARRVVRAAAHWLSTPGKVQEHPFLISYIVQTLAINVKHPPSATAYRLLQHRKTSPELGFLRFVFAEIGRVGIT